MMVLKKNFAATSQNNTQMPAFDIGSMDYAFMGSKVWGVPVAGAGKLLLF